MRIFVRFLVYFIRAGVDMKEQNKLEDVLLMKARIGDLLLAINRLADVYRSFSENSLEMHNKLSGLEDVEPSGKVVSFVKMKHHSVASLYGAVQKNVKIK